MTLLSPFQALAEKWHQTSNGDGDEFAMGYGNARDDCADELTELLGKVDINEATMLLRRELENRGYDVIEWDDAKAALESVIGVTK